MNHNNGKGRPLIIAHRGASGLAPENTIAAFRLALALGTDGIEMDVRLAADGRPVVIHDARVDRTTGLRGAVSGFTSTELAALDAGSWFERKLLFRPRVRARVQQAWQTIGNGFSGFSAERVPTLDSVLSLLKRCEPARIYIELKCTPSTEAELAYASVELVRKHRLESVTTLLSFEHGSLNVAREAAPEIATAPLFSPGRKLIPLLQGIRRGLVSDAPAEVALHFSLATRRTISELHERGTRVTVWTVNRKLMLRRLMNYGVDSIITNFPDRLLQCVDEPRSSRHWRGVSKSSR